MSLRGAVLTVSCGIVLAACANGGDTSDYLLPEGGDDGGAGSEGGTASSSSSGSSGSSSSSSGGGSGSGSSSGSSSGGDDGGTAGDAGDDGGTGSDAGDGGNPTGCMSPDTCSASATALTSLAGDESGSTDTETGTTSEWLRIDMTEQDSSPIGKPMIVTATLTSPSGSNFDLYLYLGSSVGDIKCTSPKGQSTNPGGQTDSVSFKWGETGSLANGSDDSATVMIEVRWVSGTCSAGSSWSLAVHGD
ncbi:MAG TPA: hypothetical protein VMI75_32950 [Polyangiaceae bacterium]|nr:hypothetical protein [Polyangiaceae bacterium]